MNALIIPLLLFPALAGFITIYPFAEYNYDCPTAIGNPIENENCTHTKHMIWIAVSTISLTEFGFPADCHIGICFWEETNNPDAYNNTSIIPVAIAFAVTAIIAWRSDRNNQNKFNKETTQALR